MLEAQQRDVEKLSLALAQPVSRSIDAVSASLGNLVAGIEVEGATGPALERVRRSVAATLPTMPQIGEVVVLDENGHRIFASREPSLVSDVSVDAAERAGRAERTPEIRILPPRIDDRRTDTAAIVSHRIDRPDGGFGGIVLATLSSAFYKGLYDQIDLGPAGTALLASADGVLLLRRPALADDASRDLRDTVVMHRAGVTMESTLPVVSVVDGIPRLVSYRVLPQYPLIVAASLATADYMEAWCRQVAIEVGMLLLVLAIISRLFLRNDRLELARLNNARYYQLFVENCGDLVLVKGKDADYEYASPASRAMLGYEPEELLQLRSEDLVHHDDLGALLAVQAQLSVVAPVGRTVVRNRHKDGHFIWAEAVMRLATEESTGGRRLVITIRDISARIEAEQEAEEATARARVALEATSDFVFAVDSEWRLTYMNKRLRQSRYAFSELGQTLWEIAPTLLGTPSETAYRHAMSGRIPVEATNRYGENRWFTSQCSPVDGPDGGIFVFFREVTAAKRMEDALRADRDHAETLAQAKSDFMANMSHELRTPLNAVIGFAQMLEREAPDPRRVERHRQYAIDIRQSGEHLLELINEILDYAKAEAGHLPLFQEVFDPTAMIENCVRMMGPRAERNGVGIAVELQGAPETFLADEKRVRQIVLNLLSNAVKFTLTGGRIEVACRRDHGLVITVADSGIGIADADIGRVMEAFTQVNDRHNRRQEGTGLGLPLSRRLAEMHRGTLEIDSRLGVGTTVTLWIPDAGVVVQDPVCDLHLASSGTLQEAAA